MDKWQLARYFIDAKKDIDGITYISNNVLRLRNLDLRRITNYKLTEFYINLCVVYDKSLGGQKASLKKTDNIIEATYYERDKNYAHKDDNYEKNDFDYAKLLQILKTQLEHCLQICQNGLPKELTINYLSYDRDLYRFINKLNYNDEEELKRKKSPNKQSGDSIKTLKAFYDTEDIKKVIEPADHGVILENGICSAEELQNRQDFCIKVNVLFKTNIWCSLNDK